MRPSVLVPLLVSQLGLAACGGIDDEYVEGGSRRIVTRSLRAPGVPPWQTELYDLEFHATCAFATAADGRPRCLPESTLHPAHFHDANCAEPLYWQVPQLGSCQASAFATQTRHCRDHVHHTTVREARSEAFYVSRTEECRGESREDVTWWGKEAFVLDDEIAPETFQVGEEIVQPLTTFLSERFIRAPGGARQSLGVFLAQWGPQLDCAPVQGTPRRLTCRANPSARVQTRYLDPECTDPLEVAVTTTPCVDTALEPWAMLLERPEDPWATREHYFALSTPIAQKLYVRRSPDERCRVAVDEKHHALGREVIIPRVPLEETLVGTGPLQRVVFQHEGVAIRFGQWHDRSRDHSCHILQAQDGTWRCLPPGSIDLVGEDPVYADERLRWRVHPGGEGSPDVFPGKWLVTVDYDFACSMSSPRRSVSPAHRVAAVYRIANRHFGPIYGRDREPRNPGETPYYLLDEVPLTDFPHLDVTIE